MCSWKKRLSYSLYITLFYFLLINRLAAQDCPVKPDATLRDARGGNSPFVNCTSSSVTNYLLRVENASTTQGTNTSYTIDWGDNSPIETFQNFGAYRTHTYRVLGSFK